jgi:MATE family multidrug resistance protein
VSPEEGAAAERPAGATGRHPFVHRPHRTVFALALPVLVSLVAEPLTGLADTAFVARLGAPELAALGVATALFSGVFWAFNFLGIGTQTEVATADGAGRRERAREALGAALTLALGIGVVLAVACWPFVGHAARFMGADGAIEPHATSYLRIRLLGAPATLLMMAAFGALRGLQDMRTPLVIAVGSNLLNVGLDAVLIFGAGPVPALGVDGAAWASTAAQWTAAVWATGAARARLGWPARVRLADARALLVVGRDLFLRTGLLIAFIVLATRVATRAGAETGAAHQAIRQVWILVAFLLDAWATAAQSLVGYFLGADARALARRVAWVTGGWSVATGAVLAAALWAAEPWVAAALVPVEARTVFASAWWVAALVQPLNAVAFVTDGILWGAGDYRFMRNAMLVATATGVVGLGAIDVEGEHVLLLVNVVTVAWVLVRAGAGAWRAWTH